MCSSVCNPSSIYFLPGPPMACQLLEKDTKSRHFKLAKQLVVVEDTMDERQT